MAAALEDVHVGVGVRLLKRVPVPTTLAVTTFQGAEPAFTFYGEPPSYALLEPGDVDTGLVRGAEVRDTGSPITVPVGDVTKGHVFNTLGQPLDIDEDKLDIRGFGASFKGFM